MLPYLSPLKRAGKRRGSRLRNFLYMLLSLSLAKRCCDWATDNELRAGHEDGAE